MKKRLRALLFALSLGVLALVLAVRLGQKGTTFLGARLADAEQLAALQAGPQVSGEDCILHWNGAVLPYDSAQGAYCVPQPAGGETRGNLSSSWGDIYLPAEHWGGDMTAAMREGTLLPVYVSDGSRWCELFAYVSGMPALVVKTQESVPVQRDPQEVGATMAAQPFAYNYGTVTLFWPEGNQREEVVKSRLEWHWRGNASFFAQKKSYRLNLLDGKGQESTESLLGLGDSDGWILLNLATDATRVRDKVALDIWAEMAAAYEFDPPGTTMEYVELYLDDTYLGVYGLCRPVNRKSLALSKKDRLYKWRQASMITDEDFTMLEQKESLEWLNRLEVVWPNSWQNGLWEPLRKYTDTLYTPGSLPADWETIEHTVNLDNLVDMALYKQFTCAVDNLMQNQYLLRKNEDGLFYRLPWDLNYTFGDTHEGLFGRDFDILVVPDMELDALYAADPGRTKALVAARWKELRETVLDVEAVTARMQEATRYLEVTGAWRRDYALWKENEAYRGLSENRTLPLTETIGFLQRHTRFLDGYMADYTPPSREGFDVLPQ
ncbi:CotH kinase family protein [Allofournierella sp.]|uniref:CotH kinase family protein n=1 Tax=Allofournierella sp. TaxID=1940256 RepID=UPI003AB31852